MVFMCTARTIMLSSMVGIRGQFCIAHCGDDGGDVHGGRAVQLFRRRDAKRGNADEKRRGD